MAENIDRIMSGGYSLSGLDQALAMGELLIWRMVL
jgi:hypothetical protein